MNIADCLSKAGYKRFKLHSGEVGIEIETETKAEYIIPQMTFWNSERDGSLRDFGIEYILRSPVSRGKELKSALDEFKEKTSLLNFIQDSVTTSVHVHVNFLNDTWLTLANFMTTYYLLENLLIRFSGPDRLSNLFCLPICDAEGELEVIKAFIKNIDKKSYKNLQLPLDYYKYAALNLCNLTRLGTLEVRSMRGVTDTKVITDWVNILMAIKDFAKQDGLVPFEILEMYRRQEGEILRTILPDHHQLLDRKDRDDLIKKNVWYSAMVARSGRINDSMWGFIKPKPVTKPMLLEFLNQSANEMFRQPYNDLPFALKLAVDEYVSRQFEMSRVIFTNEDL